MKGSEKQLGELGDRIGRMEAILQRLEKKLLGEEPTTADNEGNSEAVAATLSMPNAPPECLTI